MNDDYEKKTVIQEPARASNAFGYGFFGVIGAGAAVWLLHLIAETVKLFIILIQWLLYLIAEFVKLIISLIQ